MAAAAGGPEGSGFMMLIAGIDAALGKSILTILCGGAPDEVAEVADASATGTSGAFAHTGK